MSHALSVYYAPGHNRPGDMEYMRQLQPRAIRILDPDVQQLIDAHAVAPNALSLPRDWALSEQKDDMKRDPVGTGKRHAEDWRGKVNNWRTEAQRRNRPFPKDAQIIVVGINEPPVWEALSQTVIYTVSFMDECKRRGLRACALNLSVGWPANTGPDTPPNWEPYAEVYAAIVRGNHYLCLHEYWYKSGPLDGWGWWSGRLLKCPWDVPIIVGECGVDNFVDKVRWDREGGNRGWRGHMLPHQYAEQMQWYIRNLDKRVVAVLPFLTDYRSREWESFDTQEAHADFLRTATISPEPPPPPAPTEPPVVMPPSTGTGYVSALAGLNVRAYPNVTSAIVRRLSYGTPVVWNAVDGEWLRLVDGEWIHGGYVAEGKPPVTEPTPTQPPSPPTAAGIIDPLVAQAILNIESGAAFGPNGKTIIRFETHIFRRALANDALWSQHFRHGSPSWTGQEYNASGVWKPLHTGNQADEYAALAIAEKLHRNAAYESMSMGRPQIMGFNHARIGYPSAVAMYEAFSRSEAAQIIAFFNFCVASPGLIEAMRNKDWRAVARLYNGDGFVDVYAPLLEAEYRRLTA